MAGSGSEGRAAYRCLDCDTLVSPQDAWEQCACGNMYVDTSVGGGFYKHGAVDSSRVRDESTFKKSERGKTTQKAGDVFTTSEVGL